MRDKALKKSILAVVATVVLLALVGGLLIVFQLRMGRLLTDMTIQNIAETQELYAESLHTALHNQVQMLQAQTAYFYDADLSNIDEIKDKAMSGIELGDFKKIAVVNLDGVAVDLKGKTLPNMKNKSYFINALLENKVQYSDQIELDSNLEPCLVITYPFSTFRGEKGVIAGFFSYEALKQIFSIPIFSGLSYFYLVSSRGNILLFNKDKSKNIYNIDVFEYINNVSETENPELAKMKMDMIKNRPGNITLDGVEGKKLFLYAPLKINGWYIISALPFSYIHGQQTRIDMLVYMLLAAVTIAIVVFILIITVITKQVQAIKKDNKRLIIATNQAQTLIFEYDVQNQKVDFSGDTHFILGTDKNSFDISFIRGEYGSRVHPDDRQVFAHLTQALKNKDTSFSAEFRFKSFSDEYFWVKMTGSCILDADGNTKQFIGSITNVNSQVLHEQELRNIADHDRLSNLLNKAAFERNARSYLQKEGACLNAALVMIDLDNFKDVNDRLGHMTGDLAIKDAAKKISLVFSSRDYLGRFGGDEFCVLMRFAETVDKESVQKIVTKKAAELTASLREEYRKGELSVCVSASIGIALYPDNGNSYDQLFRNADEALYYTKQHGKNDFKIC